LKDKSMYRHRTLSLSDTTNLEDFKIWSSSIFKVSKNLIFNNVIIVGKKRGWACLVNHPVPIYRCGRNKKKKRKRNVVNIRMRQCWWCRWRIQYDASIGQKLLTVIQPTESVLNPLVGKWRHYSSILLTQHCYQRTYVIYR